MPLKVGRRPMQTVGGGPWSSQPAIMFLEGYPNHWRGKGSPLKEVFP